jgi:hypothetical protein
MRIKITALVILLFIAGCAQAPKSGVRTDVLRTILPKEFGPFFLPVSDNLNSISINYFTASAESTSVFFSMVGDIDWLRKDNTPSLFHRMVFNGLEESAVYQFRVDAPSDNFSGKSFIKTPPYGGNYRFDFAVVCIDSPLVLEKSPHFLIILSKKAAVGEEEFISYYTKNRKILSSTVIVPLFDLTVMGMDFSLSRDGFFVLKYKTANIILIYKEIPDLERTAGIALEDSKDDNYIVASIQDQAAIFRLTSAYRGRVKAIYALKKNCEFNPEWITVEKKDNFALKN